MLNKLRKNLNTGFYNDLDTNFEQALKMSEKEFSHEEMLCLLKNGNIPEKQIAALKLENVFNQEEANILKTQTIETLKFPFKTMRQGQRDMMKACFKIMNDKDILYVVAPTGIGKTMATMFASLKTLKENDVRATFFVTG